MSTVSPIGSNGNWDITEEMGVVIDLPKRPIYNTEFEVTVKDAIGADRGRGSIPLPRFMPWLSDAERAEAGRRMGAQTIEAMIGKDEKEDEQGTEALGSCNLRICASDDFDPPPDGDDSPPPDDPPLSIWINNDVKEYRANISTGLETILNPHGQGEFSTPILKCSKHGAPYTTGYLKFTCRIHEDGGAEDLAGDDSSDDGIGTSVYRMPSIMTDMEIRVYVMDASLTVSNGNMVYLCVRNGPPSVDGLNAITDRASAVAVSSHPARFCRVYTLPFLYPHNILLYIDVYSIGYIHDRIVGRDVIDLEYRWKNKLYRRMIENDEVPFEQRRSSVQFGCALKSSPPPSPVSAPVVPSPQRCRAL
eukprot:GHVO01022491.1.p1 GENE.GHVO01022491.1~~GHVO01022491.1.p1  ORF type:complete len:362 (+),score=82.01 GHVO01022491.1:656-1741(+)